MLQVAALWLITALILLAVRSTIRLGRLYFHDHGRSLLLVAFVVSAAIVTLLGAWIGFLLFRRFMGWPPLEWSPVITIPLLIAVLLIPVILDFLVTLVGRDPGKPDNIGRGPS